MPELSPAQSTSESSPDNFAAEFADVIPESPVQNTAIPKPTPAPALPVLKTADEEESEIKAVSFWGNLRSRRSVPKAVEPLPVLNIGRQINTLVQRKLQKEPQLRGRNISISNDEFGGIEINVDNNTYEDVAEISDPLIRMLIKVAIKEWEEGRDSA